MPIGAGIVRDDRRDYLVARSTPDPGRFIIGGPGNNTRNTEQSSLRQDAEGNIRLDVGRTLIVPGGVVNPSLPSGRVVYTGAGGTLATSSAFTYDGTVLGVGSADIGSPSDWSSVGRALSARKDVTMATGYAQLWLENQSTGAGDGVAIGFASTETAGGNRRATIGAYLDGTDGGKFAISTRASDGTSWNADALVVDSSGIFSAGGTYGFTIGGKGGVPRVQHLSGTFSFLNSSDALATLHSAVAIIGTDPGGSEILRVGGKARLTATVPASFASLAAVQTWLASVFA